MFSRAPTKIYRTKNVRFRLKKVLVLVLIKSSGVNGLNYCKQPCRRVKSWLKKRILSSRYRKLKSLIYFKRWETIPLVISQTASDCIIMIKTWRKVYNSLVGDNVHYCFDKITSVLVVCHLLCLQAAPIKQSYVFPVRSNRRGLSNVINKRFGRRETVGVRGDI